ncbi:MAG: GGDEF domain-containing protein [Lachnospiraceae bacterium]
MINDMIQWNYAPMMTLIFLWIFIQMNRDFDKNVTMYFRLTILLTVFLLLVDNVELLVAALPYPTTTRIVMSAFGFTTRILILLVLLRIALRRWKREHFHWFLVPVVFVAVVSFSALFSDLAFSYTENNTYVRGPLSFVCYGFSALYLLIVLGIGLWNIFHQNEKEGVLQAAIALMNTTSFLLEISLHETGLLRTSIALSLVFYYLHFHVELFRIDVMTGALNRRSFYDDVKKYRGRISHLLSIDLNNLKQLNDTQGHEAGDHAICTLAKVVGDAIPAECFLYRIGGDEFVVMALQKDVEQLTLFVDRVKKGMEENGYSCAIGLAGWDGENTLESTLARADELMYQDKRKTKQ